LQAADDCLRHFAARLAERREPLLIKRLISRCLAKNHGATAESFEYAGVLYAEKLKETN
jgi:hypothetical protein